MSIHTVKEFVSKKSLGGIVMHKDSKLVVRSPKDQTVIGRVEDEAYIEGVDATAIELCTQYNFKYDESLVIMEEITEEVQEEVADVTEAAEEETADVQEEVQEEETADVQEEVQEEAAEEETVDVQEDIKSVVEQTELVGGKEDVISTSPSSSPSSDLSKVFSDFQNRIQAVLSEKDLLLNKLQKQREKEKEEFLKKIEELNTELATSKTKIEKLRKAMSALQESM